MDFEEVANDYYEFIFTSGKIDGRCWNCNRVFSYDNEEQYTAVICPYCEVINELE